MGSPLHVEIEVARNVELGEIRHFYGTHSGTPQGLGFVLELKAAGLHNIFVREHSIFSGVLTKAVASY